MAKVTIELTAEQLNGYEKANAHTQTPFATTKEYVQFVAASAGDSYNAQYADDTVDGLKNQLLTLKDQKAVLAAAEAEAKSMLEQTRAEKEALRAEIEETRVALEAAKREAEALKIVDTPVETR